MSELPKKSKGLFGVSGGNSVPSDPPSFSPQSYDPEQAARWSRVQLPITNDLASVWFNLRKSPELQAITEALSDGDEPEVRNEDLPTEESLRVEFSQFGELQDLDESPLARSILAYLEAKVAVSLRHGLVQISENLFMDANELEGSDGPSIHGGLRDNTWIGPWPSGFGSRAMLNFKVYKNEQGLETAIWFVDGLLGTRPAAKSADGSLENFESDFRNERLPGLAKRLLYLSETPFPSSLASLSRKMAFGDLDSEFWPTPFYAVNDFALNTCAFVAPNGDPQLNFHIFPQSVQFGWFFSATNEVALDTQVSNSVDSLVTLVTILEDGFRNHRDEPAGASWNDTFSSVQTEQEGAKKASVARWIPLTQIGELNNHSSLLYNEAYQKDDFAVMRWVAESGSGEPVSNAINSLVYSDLLPRSQFDEAIEYLKAAIEINHYDQSTNALSNLGQVYMAKGDFQLAKQAFLEALERPDKFAEGEASLYLGDIYRTAGDEKAAETYYRRAQACGDDRYITQANSRLGLSGSGATGTGQAEGNPSTGKFCTGCGTAFSDSIQKFCGSCGTAR